MALILPGSYHKIAEVERNRISWIQPEQAERQDIRPLRIGILNIMPLGKQYEFNLLHPLGLSVLQIEPIWIRLNSHAYKSWDQNHLDQLYVSWDEALSQGPLDGLIITGAPVEHLPFEKVSYWNELVQLIEEARSTCASTLGLCWAGFALAYLAGVDKVAFQQKLFGIYPMRSLVPGHPLMGTQDDHFVCPQSRHAGLAGCRHGSRRTGWTSSFARPRRTGGLHHFRDTGSAAAHAPRPPRIQRGTDPRRNGTRPGPGRCSSA
jgi:homoserine O-succinyltransferase